MDINLFKPFTVSQALRVIRVLCVIGDPDVRRIIDSARLILPYSQHNNPVAPDTSPRPTRILERRFQHFKEICQVHPLSNLS
jgi:hypothetical protein